MRWFYLPGTCRQSEGPLPKSAQRGAWGEADGRFRRAPAPPPSHPAAQISPNAFMTEGFPKAIALSVVTAIIGYISTSLLTLRVSALLHT